LRTFVTGGGGFAGRHVVDGLRASGEEVIAPPRSELDLTDAAAVSAAIRAARPAAVLHLAALASVPSAWRDPARTLHANVGMTVNLLAAVAAEAPGAAVVLASSGEIYGVPERLPVDEDAPLRPHNPYAVSRAATDLLGAQYARSHGLRVVRMRPFNLAGPGQSDEYLVGSLSRQVAEAEREGRREVVLRVGNLDSRRDFTDVRDAARAYCAASRLDPGAYNICSETAVSVGAVVETLARVTALEVRPEQDPERVRAGDIPEVRGSAERLRAASGWAPEIALDETVRAAVDGWLG
jgi:GDP-4-dehydro-6-deoxy-D-mannose reductase